MHRLAAWLMILVYAALGSGAIEYFHNAEHAAEDALEMAIAASQGTPLDHSPIHDDENCPTHSQLHLAGLAVGWVPLLICLGLFVAFLTLLPARVAPQRVPVRISCRGPPRR